MPVQNELCGILIEDFLSIWKFRAVFLSGILVILFEGMMDLGVLELMGADSYLSGKLVPMFHVASDWGSCFLVVIKSPFGQRCDHLFERLSLP